MRWEIALKRLLEKLISVSHVLHEFVFIFAIHGNMKYL